MKIKLLTIYFIALIAILLSCKKEAGEGGNSSIRGKIWVKDYNSNLSILQNEFAGVDIDVYIIYGENISYNDKTSTNPEGEFEFKYLRTGQYKIYVVTKDTATNNFDTQVVIDKAVVKIVDIEKKKQVYDIGTIEIKD